ncbi:unnamed protein product [Schistosoma turkestanicum]|nr:unnamed protein product [Schistosoma turkestanicum]
MKSRSLRPQYYSKNKATWKHRNKSNEPLVDQTMALFIACAIIILALRLERNTSRPINNFTDDSSDVLIVRNSCPSTEEKHLSLNITISPTTSYLSCIYNFLTPMHVLQSTDGIINAGALTGLQPFYEQLPYGNHTNHSIIDYTNLNFLPDLSIWNDRSILIFATHRLKFSSTYTCPEVYVCAIPNNRHNNTNCHIELGEVSGSCEDEVNDPYFFLFPLATGLRIVVDGVATYSDDHDNSMHIIVTSGYRLQPGVFTCPSGFFACESFDKINGRHNSPLEWPYRICLPLALWCDRVLNCPITGSDEQNCSSTPPVSFPHNKTQIENEYRMLNDVLNQFKNNASLLELAGYRKIPEQSPVMVFAYVNSYWLIIMLSIMVLLFVITILLCAYKLLKRKHETTTVKVIEDHSKNSNHFSDHDDETLETNIMNTNHYYSKNDYAAKDHFYEDQTCPNDFRDNNNDNNNNNSSNNNDIHYVNGYLSSISNQEITPLINVPTKQQY